MGVVYNSSLESSFKRPFSLGLSKSCVYELKPRTLNDLKDAIRVEIISINREPFQYIHSEFLVLLTSFYKENGRPIPVVIFKK